MAEYRFTDEQNQLRDAVRKFSADHFAEENVRQLMESDPPFDQKVWARLGGELGVLGLSVPEADGGVGGTLVDQAVAVEELGAALACGPLVGTVYLAIPALVAAEAGPVRDGLLGEVVEGRRTAAFAVATKRGVSTRMRSPSPRPHPMTDTPSVARQSALSTVSWPTRYSSRPRDPTVSGSMPSMPRRPGSTARPWRPSI